MKKIDYPTFYRYSTRRSRRVGNERELFKEHKRRKNLKINAHPKPKENRRSKKAYKKFTQVEAPDELTILKNPERVISFLEKLKECYNNRIKVTVNLTNVKLIDHDTIGIMVSLLVNFKHSRINFMCKLPKNASCRKILTESGFISNLFKKYPSNESYKVSSGQNLICTHAMKIVDSKLGERVIEDLTQTIWGVPRRSQGCQRAFIELMMNTNNHASGVETGAKFWFISVNHLKEQNKVAISFVDYGVGIFKSLKSKKEGQKFYGVYTFLKSVLGFNNDAELLRKILRGDVHRTITNEPWRGKGLPGIYAVLGNNFISNLHIISNNVYANVEKDEFKEINSNFAGTFFYWEINQNNISHGAN